MLDALKKIAAFLTVFCSFLIVCIAAGMKSLASMLLNYVNSFCVYMFENVKQWLGESYLSVDAPAFGKYVGMIRESGDDLYKMIKVPAYYFDIYVWAKIVIAAYGAKLAVRLVRWVLSCIPALNTG